MTLVPFFNTLDKSCCHILKSRAGEVFYDRVITALDQQQQQKEGAGSPKLLTLGFQRPDAWLPFQL